jgi:hypothetical protein
VKFSGYSNLLTNLHQHCLWKQLIPYTENVGMYFVFCYRNKISYT